jgi:hypothetical protein
MPDCGSVFDDRCDTRFVELSQNSKPYIHLSGSFNRFPLHVLSIVAHCRRLPHKFSSHKKLKAIVVHDKLALTLLISLPGNVDEFGLLRSEAGPNSPGPGFDPVYVLGLNFGQVLFRA